jgi:hypothetical protein
LILNLISWLKTARSAPVKKGGIYMHGLDSKTLQDIHKQEGRIRDLINTPRKQYLLMKQMNLWSQLCSCLDVIGDTELAIAAYIHKEFSQSTDAHYLAVYGLLQALFLQQDALFHLCEALGIGDPRDNYPRLKEIREDRHASVGHPTKLKRGKHTSYHFISRISLGSEGFDLATDNDDGTTVFRKISIPLLITDQNKYASHILSAIITALEQEEAAHKEQFSMDKLNAAFPETLGYHFQKVIQCARTGENAEFGTANLKMIKKALQDFQSALERRGLGLDTYDVVQDIYDLLTYPLAELEACFQDLGEGKTPRINDKTAYIFAFFINEQSKKLREIASEIDEDYLQQPEQELVEGHDEEI